LVSFFNYPTKKTLLIQPCPKFTFGGGVLPPDLRHLRLIFWDKIWYSGEGVKVGPLDFFGARKVPGGFRIGLQRKNFTSGL
jgi:hypothetical protein